MANTNATALYSAIVVLVLYKLIGYLSYKISLRRHNCVSLPQYPHKDPFLGIDLFLRLTKAFQSGTFLDFNKTLFDNYGKTFVANGFGKRIIRTIDPEVPKAVHSTYFDNFGLQPLRYETAKHLWGNGIIVVDGPHWKHGRRMMRSSFDTVHIANLDRLRKHVQVFLDLIPRDGSTIDLAPPFKRLILDTSSEFIFGKAMGALTHSARSDEFIEAFAYAQRGTGIRALLGRFKFLHRDRKWWGRKRLTAQSKNGCLVGLIPGS